VETEGDEGAFFADCEAVDGADGVLVGLAAIGGEGFEVVGALEGGGGMAECVEVEGGVDVPGAVEFEGGEDGGVPNPVEVDLAGGGRVCSGGRGFRAGDWR
jgi:hypothetical protein